MWSGLLDFNITDNWKNELEIMNEAKAGEPMYQRIEC